MDEPVKSLDPLALPLHGSHLIEASAGTGKTWTIAVLYLRLVLGHGCPPRLPADILVMTFTRAATRELSHRIRSRLVEAAAAFRGEPVPQPDSLLSRLIQAYPQPQDRERAAWRLSAAAQAMDDAAIHTIDAWCQRMLREHAFDSGCLFDEELQAQEEALLIEAARDYWRQQVYSLPDAALDTVLVRWRDVDALVADVKPLVDKPWPESSGHGTLSDAVARGHSIWMKSISLLRAAWPTHVADMRAWFEGVWADTSPAGKKLASALPRKNSVTEWLRDLKEWSETPSPRDLKLTDTAWKRLRGHALRSDLATVAPSLAVPDCFDAFSELKDQLDDLPEPSHAWRQHAAVHIAGRINTLKAQSRQFGFADMLNRLDRALDDAAPADGLRGPDAARRLRERILAQYPVALIDEFQDTSPLQLRIFDRLYRIADNAPQHTLLLIGDPKQAIYKFRGADIHSYLKARRATEGRHHVLGTNYRSTRAVVNTVNALFKGAEDRSVQGAFLFGSCGGASEVPFVPVDAQGRSDHLVCSQGTVPALTFVADPVERNKDDSRALFAAWCAERIVELLNDPAAGFEEPGKPHARLRPADIAVLVNTGREADAVRRELRRRRVSSVYLSDKDSVFQTPEATDLLRLLQAVAAPRDLRLARAALATSLMGLPLAALHQLAHDDQAMDRQVERLQQLARVWKAQGVLAMVRRALHEFDLPARWLSAADPDVQGERRLTNVLHLAELLQAASAHAVGEQALLGWLQQQLTDDPETAVGGDERLLRLESDADLVQVITVHKSKGLEYPVVFLPFAAHFNEVLRHQEKRRDAVLLMPDAKGGQRAVLGPTQAELEAEDRERLRENLRLLYVALTRARHALWVGLSGLVVGNARTYEWHRSAIGYLLSGLNEQPLSQPPSQPSSQRLTDIRTFVDRAGCEPGSVVLQVLETPDPAEAAGKSARLPQPASTRLQRRNHTAPLVEAPPYQASFDRGWSISSYTALVRDASWSDTATGTVPPRLLRDDEPQDLTPEAATGGNWGGPQGVPADTPWHRFPRGALPGNFLHEQLEWLAHEGFALDASEDLRQRLLRRCERQGWGHRADDVLAWMREVCRTPLPPLGVSLAQLSATQPEMEFWFPTDQLRTPAVDALCGQHIQPGQARPLLLDRSLQGMLMGFMDLVFEHQGRYWVLDYKSNALGPRDADYTQAALQRAMLEHRYDVQAALYLVALHRLLLARMGGRYQPSQHLGGAVYLFMRGVHGPEAGCCTVPAPVALVEQLDALLPAAKELA